MALVSSNYIDDGAVIFLNGVEMARFRVPIDQTAGTFASAGPAVEGQNDVAMYAPTPGALQPGDNVMAVEVHQINTTSADVVWAMNLTARFSAVPPVAITSQPQSITTAQDHASTLAVAAAGASPAYQWQRDNGGGVFTNIPNATASVFFIASTQPANAGAYRVIVGNCASSQTSSVAMLMVVPDLQGPRLVSAIANATVNGLPPSILVAFDEPVTNVTDIANYSITSTPPGHSLIISNAVGNGFTLVQLRTSPWLTNTDYILTVNHVRDKSPAGNVIAPDSQSSVSFYRDIFHLDQPWVWEDSGTDLGTAWTARDYDDGWWCGRPAAPGVFYFDLTPPLCGERLTHVRFGPNTYYFRTHFNIRPTTGRASVILTHVLDDGAVFYLNGTELNRYNIAAGEVTYATPATTEIASAVCMTTTALPVNNLLTGDNVLAVEVHQFSPSSALNSDMAFGLQLTAAVQPLLPAEPLPVLVLARQGTNLTLSWQGHGYALEFATNLSGAWFPMPNTANPFNATAGDAARFFRLRRPQ